MYLVINTDSKGHPSRKRLKTQKASNVLRYFVLISGAIFKILLNEVIKRNGTSVPCVSHWGMLSGSLATSILFKKG